MNNLVKKFDVILSFQKEIIEDNLMNKQEKQLWNKMKKEFHALVPQNDDDELPQEDCWAAPNTQVEVPPNMKLPVCEPNGLVLPNGLGTNGLVLELVSPKTDWEPKGLDEDCAKAVERITQIYQRFAKVINK